MEIRILPVAVREVERVAKELKESIYGVLQRLEDGGSIPMPMCKPLFSIERGLYELRFSDKAGEYRVFYYIRIQDAIYVIHGMRKKRQKLDRRTIELLKTRIRSIL